ncbi:MAG: hypothetical protein PUP46_01735 [Endozoicomonas sp. (ex Botrylloides leachii)]|nr:hypothetical protein [Endozoicomonas sp. (ex Botrylloides leachii)]
MINSLVNSMMLGTLTEGQREELTKVLMAGRNGSRTIQCSENQAKLLIDSMSSATEIEGRRKELTKVLVADRVGSRVIHVSEKKAIPILKNIKEEGFKVSDCSKLSDNKIFLSMPFKRPGPVNLFPFLSRSKCAPERYMQKENGGFIKNMPLVFNTSLSRKEYECTSRINYAYDIISTSKNIPADSILPVPINIALRKIDEIGCDYMPEKFLDNVFENSDLSSLNYDSKLKMLRDVIHNEYKYDKNIENIIIMDDLELFISFLKEKDDVLNSSIMRDILNNPPAGERIVDYIIQNKDKFSLIAESFLVFDFPCDTVDSINNNPYLKEKLLQAGIVTTEQLAQWEK